MHRTHPPLMAGTIEISDPAEMRLLNPPSEANVVVSDEDLRMADVQKLLHTAQPERFGRIPCVQWPVLEAPHHLLSQSGRLM